MGDPWGTNSWEMDDDSPEPYGISVNGVKALIKVRMQCLEEKYSANAFEVKDEHENRSLKMYLQIKDHPVVKKYVLNAAMKEVTKLYPELDGLKLLEAKYDLERELGIKK